MHHLHISDPNEPAYEADPLSEEEEFQFAQFSIDRWMRRVPCGYLAGTEHGHSPGRDVPAEILVEGPLQQIYLLDLALFIGAERTGVRAAAGLARIAPDEGSLLFLSSQVLDEARHFEAFATRFRALGIGDDVRDDLANQFMPAPYRAFLDEVLAAVDEGDFEAGLIGLNVILEGMAFPLYDYEVRYWQPFDPGLAEIVQGAYLDECRHVGFGEKRLAWLLGRDPGAKRRIQKKVDRFAGRMRAAFREFLDDYVALYDMAVQAYPERCQDVEIIPGKRLVDTSTEEQVRWLEAQIEDVHRNRLGRLGLEVQRLMDPANRFHSRGTFALMRFEYVLAFLLCVVLGWLHQDVIDWLRYGLLFVAIDLIGYLPGRLAHTRGGGRRLPRVYYLLYNTTHSLAFSALVALVWSLTLGAEWALLALPTHLCADRGLLGNVFKSSRLPFEADASGFERFEARLVRRTP